MKTYDYIVVGGGSAGCVLAHRLITAGKSVLMLESGPKDNIKFIEMPATFVKVLGTERSWNYQSEPQPGAAGRVTYVPQGRTLGGGSSLNAMVYIRGGARDYDSWRDAGCTGWGWDDVLPVFRRAESNQRFSNRYHGTDGVLKVSDQRFRHPLSRAFVKAGQEAGYEFRDDFNGDDRLGIGFYQTTTFDGRRGSTASTYLRAVENNPNLTVMTGAHVSGLLIQNGAATGVAYRLGVDADGNGGTEIRAEARAEVILAAGALSTPKLLMLAGIGPAEHLRGLGIDVVRDLPEVGRNYQDHLEVSIYGRTRDPISMFGQDKGLAALSHGLQYMLYRSGLLSSNVVESGGFIDTAGQGFPDIQFHVLPALVGDMDREPLEGHGLSINPCILHPKSRGSVHLRSANPQDPIRFDAGALNHPDDVATLVRGVKAARNIMRQPSLQKLIAKELLPGEAADLPDTMIEQHVRKHAKTVYHPAGTCRMGGDERAVVDCRLQVNGVRRLRIADASIMPTLMGGNTNAPTIMIAERCADFLLNRQ